MTATATASDQHEYHLPFLERKPKAPSLSGKAPLLILLHGRAAEAKTIFSIEGLLDPRFHIIAIRATYDSVLGGFEWFRTETETRSDELHDAERFEESERLLTEDIERHIASRDIDPANVFFWGFSQGAAMSLILGLRDRLHPRGVVPMAGFLPSPVKRWDHWNSSACYVFVHGTSDEVLPPETSQNAMRFLESKGVSCEYYEYRGRHKMTLDSIAHVNQWLLEQARIL